MTKQLPVLLIVIFAMACLVMTLFMPFAELGLLNAADQMPENLRKWAEAKGALGLFESVRAWIVDTASDLRNDRNFEYYAYALVLGLALIAASIAINVIGREESEEKTVLPLKK